MPSKKTPAKPVAKKSATKPPATKTPPTKAAVTSAPWADDNLKIRATLSWLDTAAKNELKKAIKAHVDGEDMDLSPAMRAFLVGYPLDAAALASLRNLDNAYAHLPSLIPLFEG